MICGIKRNNLEYKVFELLGTSHLTLRLKWIVHLNLPKMCRGVKDSEKCFPWNVSLNRVRQQTRGLSLIACLECFTS